MKRCLIIGFLLFLFLQVFSQNTIGISDHTPNATFRIVQFDHVSKKIQTFNRFPGTCILCEGTDFSFSERALRNQPMSRTLSKSTMRRIQRYSLNRKSGIAKWLFRNRGWSTPTRLEQEFPWAWDNGHQLFK
ncbi:MAG: hypothetical protein AAFV80_23645 [Bacteroidota bacterium]